MKSHHIATALLVLGLVAPAWAADWTIDSNPGRPASFRTLQAAHDSASVAAGDTLYLLPSSVSYGSLTATKRLTVIGPGYLLNQNLSFANAVPSARADTITLNATASGSFYTGLETTGDFDLNGANNVTIKRNLIGGGIGTASGAACANLRILQNFVMGSGFYCLEIDTAGGSGEVLGNYFDDGILVQGGTFNFQFNTVNCHYTTDTNVVLQGYTYAANNLIKNGINLSDNALAESNWRSATYFSTPAAELSGNAWTANTTFSGQFLGTGTVDGRWRLKSGAAVIGTGKNGATPGMFSGPDAYVLSGLPSVPMVIGIQAPSSASPSTGLPVTVTLQVAP